MTVLMMDLGVNLVAQLVKIRTGFVKEVARLKQHPVHDVVTISLKQVSLRYVMTEIQ